MNMQEIGMDFGTILRFRRQLAEAYSRGMEAEVRRLSAAIDEIQLCVWGAKGAVQA